MAKKKKNRPLHESIEIKQQKMRQTYVVQAVALTIIFIYFGLMYSAYSYDNPTEGMVEKLSSIVGLIPTRPLYFIPFRNMGSALSIIAGILTLLLLFLFIQYSRDKQRIHHDINTMKGSAEWASIKDIVERFASGNEKTYLTDYNNLIMSKHVQVSLDQRKHFHALNTLVLGTTGTGKSRYLLKPNLLQANCSYVITDPKGEILQSCGEMLRRFGYKIRVFDLTTMSHCDTYNPLRYCNTEADIKKLVQAFIENTTPGDAKGGGSKDPFWDDSMNAFLCACISLLIDYGPGNKLGNDPIKVFGEAYGDEIPTACFANLCELTRAAGAVVDQRATKNNSASGSKLNKVFECLRAYEAEKQNCAIDYIEEPYCLREWKNFKLAPEKTSTTILMTTAVRLDPFNIEQVKNLTSSDTIHLDEIGNGRDALFVITPANDKTYNFLVSFLYTQLFNLLYVHGEKECQGSLDLVLPNGELVRHFSIQDVYKGLPETTIPILKKATMNKVSVKGNVSGSIKVKNFFGQKKKKPITIDDSYYEIMDGNGDVLTRRPTKALAEQYIADLQNAVERKGVGTRVPCHVRFLLDEFPNICSIPAFKEKLSTMRSYEISVLIICQTITQLKGMYEKDYEVVDANCPFTIFLGGDENTNNEYISKKMGKATQRSGNASVNQGTGKAGGGSNSYNTEERELMKQEELGKLPFEEQIVLIYGENPIRDKKYDYPAHKNYKFTYDYAVDCGANKDGHFAFEFDRSCFSDIENVSLFQHYERASAVPSVQPATDEILKEKLGFHFSGNDIPDDLLAEALAINDTDSTPVEF